MSAQNQRIVVTGASGFIGCVLVHRAREAGHDVVPLCRSDLPMPSAYEDPETLARIFSGADAVVHLAARAHQSGTDPDFECNIRAARAVARAAAWAGVSRVVLLSSIGVNGNATRFVAFHESDTPAPVEPYSRSKLRCEQEVQAILADSQTKWTIVRPPLVYGADAPGNFGRLVRAVRHGLPLPLGAVCNERSLLSVHNLADAILLCVRHPQAANEIFLLADEQSLSTPTIIRCIARGVGQPARLWNAPPLLLRAAAKAVGRKRIAESLCSSLLVDASKARRVLGWCPAIRSADGITEAAAASDAKW